MISRKGLGYCLTLVALAWVALLAAEGALRVTGRLAQGAWPVTAASRFHSDIRETLRAYRRHPFLSVTPQEGSSVSVFGKELTFNRHGYRSPERSLKKSEGTIRVLCAGGSTTLDLHSPTDEGSWPWRLEGLLKEKQMPVEVWNAGFSGWTSLENLISFALRDLDLEPDVVVLFQGINDLQAGSRRPFDAAYEAHAGILVRSLGFELPLLRWWETSMLYELARNRSVSSETPWRRLESPGPLSSDLSPGAVETFRRNLHSFLALARARGISVVLATQSVRVRSQHTGADRRWLENWTYLEADAIDDELKKLNQVLRELALQSAGSGSRVVLADWAASSMATDEDFSDPAHFSPSGSAKMAAFIADVLLDSALLLPAS